MPDPKRILIIEDEREICELFKEKCEGLGYEAHTALTGEDGFEKAVRLRPDCVLLDIRLPEADGLTFLRRLRGYRDDDDRLQSLIRSSPVIVLTAAGSQMKPLFDIEGIVAYLEKPFDPEILKDRIQKAVLIHRV